jgi:gluconolactonase
LCEYVTNQTRIVPEGTKWQEVSRAGRFTSEGVVAAKDGKIYVSDITRPDEVKPNNPGGTIYPYDPATGHTAKYMEPSGMSNGLHVDRNGDLIIAQEAEGGRRAILRRNLITA